MSLTDARTEYSGVFRDHKEGFLLFAFQPEAAMCSLSNCVCLVGIDNSVSQSVDIKNLLKSISEEIGVFL